MLSRSQLLMFSEIKNIVFTDQNHKHERLRLKENRGGGGVINHDEVYDMS